MKEKEFYNGFGFDDNPFQFTNADEEDRLANYFVPPPYFASVVGNPDKPSPTIVFAPRGGGKSAQRRMIELNANSLDILSVTYDRLEFSQGENLHSVTLDYHLNNIIKRVLLGILYKIDSLGLSDINFSSEESKLLSALCQQYLGHMTQPELVHAIKSLRNFQERIKVALKDYVSPISGFINLILKAKGIPTVNFDIAEARPTRLDQSQKYNLEQLGILAKSIGFKSVYVLIDKVDETQFTGNDSNASYKLIESLIRDIELLSIPNYGFNFFLWDKIKPFHIQYARPDRVQQFELQWEYTKIAEALNKRLSAYSSGKINNLSQISKEHAVNFTTNLTLFFANNSPRDVIRICQEICAQQMEINPHLKTLSQDAIYKGIDFYCLKRVNELIDIGKLREFKKLRKLDFTINYVANEVFKIENQAASGKIQGWISSGLVQKVGEKKVQTSRRPVFHYAVVDVRLARVIFEEISLLSFVLDKVQRCERCSTVVLRDWDKENIQTCHNCGNQIINKLNVKVEDNQ
jgi:DNA-directed RNA polymerase subunit RPC12/RpoP